MEKICFNSIKLQPIIRFRPCSGLKKKLVTKPKARGGFRSVAGTGAWQKLKETTAV